MARVSPPAERWRRLLRTGRFPLGWEGDTSGSAVVWWVCIGAIREGLDLTDVRPLLAASQNGGGLAYRRRAAKRRTVYADKWLEQYVWPSAAEAAARRADPPRDAAEARARVKDMSGAVQVQGWSGVAGATDRAVIAFLQNRGLERGSLVVACSQREIVESVSISRKTVGTALGRLKAGGWLQEARKGGGATVVASDGFLDEMGLATLWRLCLPSRFKDARDFPTGGTPIASTSLNGVDSRDRGEGASDLFRWGGGLGLNGPRVLDALAAGPLTAREVAEALGLNVGHLRYRVLPKMEALGLVFKDDDGRWVVASDLDAALDAAAAELGLAGRSREVQAAHERERADFAEYRERTRPMRQARRREHVGERMRSLRPDRQATEPLWLVSGEDEPARVDSVAEAPPCAVEGRGSPVAGVSHPGPDGGL